MRLLLILVTVFFAFLAAETDTPVFTADGYAIHGFDTVAYFKENKAVQGKTNFTFEWNGAIWLFSRVENLHDFIADPKQYAPQYGGYCAYAVAKGYTASTDPDAFTVFEDRLYLNYSTLVRVRWQLQKTKYIHEADRNWPSIQAKLE